MQQTESSKIEPQITVQKYICLGFNLSKKVGFLPS